MRTAPPDLRAPRRVRLVAAAVTTALLTTVLGVIGAPTASAAAAPIRIVGSGYGHGVGMSQWGAQNLALSGRTATEILTHYYRGTTVTTAAVPTNLRIQVGTGNAFTITAGGSTTLKVEGMTSPPPPTIPALATGATATVQRNGGGTTIKVGTTTYGPLAAGARVVVTYPTTGPVRLSPPNHRYKWGSITLSENGGGLQAVVGGLTMDQYLYGLGEVPSSWHAEALKTQAIAGRTYAAQIIRSYGSGRASRSFDLFSSTIHQAYIGFEKEGGAMGSAWVKAVDDTVGRMVLYNGVPINALYSASSGGHTENSEYVWSSALPYLRGVPDPQDATGKNPSASWTREFDPTRLGGFFGVGTVTRIAMTGTTGVSGRVDKASFTVTGTTGSVTMTGARFRQTINARVPFSEQLRSTKFRVFQPPTGRIESATSEGLRVTVGGWAVDPDSPNPVNVEVVLSSPAGTVRRTVTTNIERADVAKVWGGSTKRGYRVALDVPAVGDYRVCINVQDLPGTALVRVRCGNVTVSTNTVAAK